MNRVLPKKGHAWPLFPTPRVQHTPKLPPSGTGTNRLHGAPFGSNNPHATQSPQPTNQATCSMHHRIRNRAGRSNRKRERAWCMRLQLQHNATTTAANWCIKATRRRTSSSHPRPGIHTSLGANPSRGVVTAGVWVRPTSPTLVLLLPQTAAVGSPQRWNCSPRPVPRLRCASHASGTAHGSARDLHGSVRDPTHSANPPLRPLSCKRSV